MSLSELLVPLPNDDEAGRLAALASYEVLDTDPEQSFDDIVRIATQLCDTPVALVSLVGKDRQWFKARVGFEPCETTLDRSVCRHAIGMSDLLVIPDLTLDERSRENPLVTGEPHIRFYAGAPLTTPEGATLGTICVIDHVPRPGGLTDVQAESLRALARQVMTLLSLRKTAVDRALQTKRMTALVDFGERLRDLDHVDQIVEAAARCIANAVDASRTGFGRVDLSDEVIDVPADFCSAGIASIAGRHGFQSFRPTIDELKLGRTIAISDVETDPLTARNASAFLAIQARAILNLPIIEQGQLTMVLFVHHDHAHPWTEDELLLIRQVGDRAHVAIERVSADRQQRVVNQEISHRLKNTLSMVQAIAAQTLRQVSERDAVDALTQRIGALARAHEVLLHENWSNAAMRDVTHSVLSTFDAQERFTVAGPDILLGPRATLSYSLLLHELGTNAIKYGALSTPKGHVELDWKVVGDNPDRSLELTWREAGGPAVSEPTGRGFGSRLIRMGLIGTGGVELHYHSSGFVARMQASLSQLQQS